MKLWERLVVPPGRRVHLADWDPDDTAGHKKDAATEHALGQDIARLDELQYVMFADHRHALLVMLQAMDAGGKDGTIRHVGKLVPKEVWAGRYDHINRFEGLLGDSGVTVVKFFLHISKDEQKRRFEERLTDRTKQWKLAPEDFEDRKYWDGYVEAYEDALSRCSTDVAPWFVIPANKKWFRNLAVSHILVHALERLDLKFPKPSFDVSRVKLT